MRSVSEYLTKAREFESLAEQAADDALKLRYIDVARCYLLLAQDRVRLIQEGAIISNQDLQVSETRDRAQLTKPS